MPRSRADRLWLGAFLAWLDVRARQRRRRARFILRLAPLLPVPVLRRLPSRRPLDVPRIVWIYWDTGLAAAPPLVRTCVASWQALNPGWEIRVLDGAAAAAMVDLSCVPASDPPSKRANLLRIELLARYGGVWADATTLCLRPLDDWLPAAAASGFFGFSRPAPDRPVANWFLCSAPGHPVALAWARLLRRYWELRGRTDDYFVMHLLLHWALRANARLRRHFAEIPVISAGPPHALQTYLRATRPGEAEAGQLRKAIYSEQVPVMKLDWRIPDGAARLEAVMSMFVRA